MNYPDVEAINVFPSIPVADVAAYIYDAVSKANTFLSSIRVGDKFLKNLNNLSGNGKNNCIKSLTQLRMEVGDKCKGLSYFSTPKSFLDDFENIITNYKNKSMSNGARGVTVIDIINTYTNILQASISNNVGTKYYNGVKASIYKYPPQWIIKKENEPGEGGPRDQHNPLTQITPEKKDDVFPDPEEE